MFDFEVGLNAEQFKGKISYFRDVSDAVPLWNSWHNHVSIANGLNLSELQSLLGEMITMKHK